MPKLLSNKPPRQPAPAAVRHEAQSAVRLLRKVAEVVTTLLPDASPSWQRVALRDVITEATVLLGETLVARESDVAWENEPDENPSE